MELFLKEYLMKIAIHSRRTFLTRSLAAGTAFGLGGCPKPGSDGAADRAATADGHAELEGLFATWADALHYAHTQGTLHRDIKPANLLLDASGVVWLTDFGLSKAARSDDVSVAGDMVGTLRYMAPERFRGQADQRSDIYSLGLSLYELLVFEPAYQDTDRTHLIQRISREPPPPPSQSNPQIPRDLETIILKAIAQDPDHRYLSAGALADDLRCFLEDRPIQARRVGPLERLGRWCRRNKAVAGLAGTTLFLLILVAVIASVGYVRTKTALQGEADQRDKAEANAALAVEAIDRIFERFSPSHIVIRPPLTMEGVEGETIEVPSPPVLSKETVALLEEMLPFYDRLARQTGDAEEQLRERTAEAKFRVAAIRQRLGQLDEAVKAYQQAITTFQELGTSSPSSKTFQLRIAGIQNELGRLYQSQRRSVEARIHHKLGSFLRQTDRFSEAEQSLRKATAIQSSLVEQFPNAPYYKVWLGTFQIALGDVLIRINQPQQACSLLEEAINMLTRLLTDQPEMEFIHGQLSRGYSNLAVALRQSGQRDSAAQAERHAEQEQDIVRNLP